MSTAFDIREKDGVDAGHAAMTTNGLDSTLHAIDLGTGAATLVGAIGPPSTLLRALTLQPDDVFRSGFE